MEVLTVSFWKAIRTFCAEPLDAVALSAAAPLRLTLVSIVGLPVIVSNSTPAVTDCSSKPDDHKRAITLPSDKFYRL